MDEMKLSEEENWMIESLMRNLIYDSKCLGNVELEERFYSMMIRKYGQEYTKKLAHAIHDSVQNIREAVYAA